MEWIQTISSNPRETELISTVPARIYDNPQVSLKLSDHSVITISILALDIYHYADANVIMSNNDNSNVCP